MTREKKSHVEINESSGEKVAYENKWILKKKNPMWKINHRKKNHVKIN